MSDMDAILWMGCTPPDLEYFSARSYVFSHSAHAAKPLMSEVVEFASIGDAANNLRFNSTGGSRSPDNLNKSSAIIITGNTSSIRCCSPSMATPCNTPAITVITRGDNTATKLFPSNLYIEPTAASVAQATSRRPGRWRTRSRPTASRAQR